MTALPHANDVLSDEDLNLDAVSRIADEVRRGALDISVMREAVRVLDANPVPVEGRLLWPKLPYVKPRRTVAPQYGGRTAALDAMYRDLCGRKI